MFNEFGSGVHFFVVRPIDETSPSLNKLMVSKSSNLCVDTPVYKSV